MEQTLPTYELSEATDIAKQTVQEMFSDSKLKNYTSNEIITKVICKVIQRVFNYYNLDEIGVKVRHTSSMNKVKDDLSGYFENEDWEDWVDSYYLSTVMINLTKEQLIINYGYLTKNSLRNDLLNKLLNMLPNETHREIIEAMFDRSIYAVTSPFDAVILVFVDYWLATPFIESAKLIINRQLKKENY